MSKPQKQYSHDIDILKAILVIGMIIVHVISLLGSESAIQLARRFVAIIVLISYSGFLFSFGYTAWLSYFSTDSGLTRIVPTILRIIIAYYLSSFIYIFFVEREYAKADILSILTISRMVPYSEFLLGFALTLLLGFLCKRPIQFIMERPRFFFITNIVLLLTVFFPVQWVQPAQLSLFFGSNSTHSFPLFPYFPVYLTGLYFARYQIKPNILIGMAGIAVYYFFKKDMEIVRFPPSFSFIVISMFFVLTWYSISRFLSRWQIFKRLLSPVGVNTLFYLLISNIFIFAIRGAMPKLSREMPLITTVGISLAIIISIYFLTTIVRQVKLETREPSESA